MTTQPTKDQPSISSLLSNPRVATALSILGLVSTLTFGIFAIFTYVQTSHKRVLTFSINPARTVVVNTKQSSRLSVAFDGEPVRTDLTAVQVAFWNDGNESIRKSNNLKPLVIATENGVPILEATVLKVSRDVSQITLDLSSIRDGRITVNWDILEQNDGAVIQIIYAGSPTVVISAQAVVETQGEVNSSTDQTTAITNSYRNVGRTYLVIAGTMVTALAITFLLRRALSLDGLRDMPIRYIVINLAMPLFLVIFSLLMGLYYILVWTPASPPFGF